MSIFFAIKLTVIFENFSKLLARIILITLSVKWLCFIFFPIKLTIKVKRQRDSCGLR